MSSSMAQMLRVGSMVFANGKGASTTKTKSRPCRSGIYFSLSHETSLKPASVVRGKTLHVIICLCVFAWVCVCVCVGGLHVGAGFLPVILEPVARQSISSSRGGLPQ